jgi:hypothetical protein
MDDFGKGNPGGQNVNGPSSFDDKSAVSRSPLHLGGGGETPQAPKVSPAQPAAKNPASQTAPSDRITGVKTFFTKLHAGAIEFLDEQIAKWLKENPDVSIKRINTVTGEIQGKKTEPNIIITVWY